MAANGTLAINQSEIYDNRVSAQTIEGLPRGYGGGVYVANNISLLISDSRIADNYAQGPGGGIAMQSNATLTMTGSEISGNSADWQGGGLYLVNTTAVVSQSRIHNNEVYAASGTFTYGEQGGGGLFIQSSSNVTIRQTLVASNSVYNIGLGGGIAVNCWRCTNTIVVENSTLSGNRAVDGGGGFSSYIEQGSTGSTNSAILFNHVSVINNNATSGNGHAVNQERATGSDAHVSNVTSSFSYQNSLIAGNGAAGGNECRNSATHLPGSLVQTSGGYNLFIAGAGCTDNGTTDQTVADQATLFSTVVSATLSNQGGDTLVHALNASGAAVDAIPDGTNGCVGGTSVDQRGAVRAGEVVPGDGRGGTACDIGAHEGESSETPTAVTNLHTQTSTPSQNAYIPLLATLLTLLSGAWLWLRRPTT